MEQNNHLILVAVGPDNVGLVEKISEFIAQRGCNIEDSKMAVFLGEFALILLITGDERHLAQIANAAEELSSQTGLHIWAKRPTVKKSPAPSLPYRLVASCMDHPGVVHRISTTLSKQGVNIESMETDTYDAPVSGTPIFRMEAIISVPTGTNVNNLRALFADIEREENIDIDLSLIS
jgi:glycine cleavage system transcriptional repressor